MFFFVFDFSEITTAVTILVTMGIFLKPFLNTQYGPLWDLKVKPPCCSGSCPLAFYYFLECFCNFVWIVLFFHNCSIVDTILSLVFLKVFFKQTRHCIYHSIIILSVLFFVINLSRGVAVSFVSIFSAIKILWTPFFPGFLSNIFRIRSFTSTTLPSLKHCQCPRGVQVPQ